MMKWLRLASFLVSGLLCLCLEAWADWSPEIHLWDGGYNETGPTNASLAIDADENVHIAYEFDYRYQGLPRASVAYVKVNDHGQILVGPVMLTDSSDWYGDCPRIGLFGIDSLIVMWFQQAPVGNGSQLVSRTISIDGTQIGPLCLWADTVSGSSSATNTFVLGVGADRTVAVAYTRHEEGRYICASSRLPDGSRPLNDAVIWQRQDQNDDYPYGFLDATDSLQLMWRQRNITDQWDAVYTKRVSVLVPPDSAERACYTALTPEQSGVFYGLGDIQPYGDSLVAVIVHPEGFGVAYLHIVRRCDYAQVTQMSVGGVDRSWQVVGDSVIEMVDGQYQPNIHFQRRGLPSLQLLEDTVLALYGASNALIPWAYGMSPHGVRHVVYTREDPNYYHMIYRFWRSDLAAPDPRRSSLKSQFAVSPNPTNGTITLSGPVSQILRLELFNILGQRINIAWPEKAAQKAEALSLNLDAVPSGTYYLHITTRQGAQIQKVSSIR